MNPEPLEDKQAMIAYKKCFLPDDVAAACEWLQQSHVKIKDNFLQQFKQVVNKEEKERLGDYADMISNLWINKIEEAFPDIFNRGDP